MGTVGVVKNPLLVTGQGGRLRGLIAYNKTSQLLPRTQNTTKSFLILRYSPTTSNLRILEEEFLGSEYKIYVWPQEHLHTKEEGHDWKTSLQDEYARVDRFQTSNFSEWTVFARRRAVGRSARSLAPTCPRSLARTLSVYLSLTLARSIPRFARANMAGDEGSALVYLRDKASIEPPRDRYQLCALTRAPPAEEERGEGAWSSLAVSQLRAHATASISSETRLTLSGCVLGMPFVFLP
eukprot:scaffold59039_cov29-Tisochrysis_lutea.AAC.7